MSSLLTTLLNVSHNKFISHTVKGCTVKITLLAQGYTRVAATLVSAHADYALVSVERKRIDKAPRVIRFNWDAILEDSETFTVAPEAPVLEMPAPEIVGDLDAVQAVAFHHMLVNGLIQDGWQLVWTRSISTAGICKYGPKTIGLSKPLMSLWTLTQARQVILHEIAHALTPGAHHGRAWKLKCVELGIDPKRLWGSDGEAHVKPLYAGSCRSCGKAHGRNRMKPNTRYYCTECRNAGAGERALVDWTKTR